MSILDALVDGSGELFVNIRKRRKLYAQLPMALGRKIYNPCTKLVHWPTGTRSVEVEIERTGIIKYIDVYDKKGYQHTYLCEPIGVGLGDKLIINMTEVKKWNEKECFVIKMHLPPVHNGPMYGNVNGAKEPVRKGRAKINKTR